jgi:hypothetical protein
MMIRSVRFHRTILRGGDFVRSRPSIALARRRAAAETLAPRQTSIRPWAIAAAALVFWLWAPLTPAAPPAPGLGQTAPGQAAPASAPSPPPRPHYICSRAEQPPAIDGKLDDAAWKRADWTAELGDIISGKKVPLSTRAKMLWDDTHLYIAADLREPHLRARIDRRDQYVYRENAFELFIDPDGDHQNYAEIEINAINNVADIRMDKPYRDGGNSDLFWDVAGMRTAVHAEGTLNDAGDVDRGWTVEFAIPWRALASMAGRTGAPEEGAIWRMNLARVEYPVAIENGRYQHARGIEWWSWSPQGEVNLHAPERWGFVQFSPSANTPFKTEPAVTAARDLLMRIYHAQSEYRQAHTEWTTRLEDLSKQIGPIPAQVAETKLLTTPAGWEATAAVRTDNGLQIWHVRQDSKLWRE